MRHILANIALVLTALLTINYFFGGWSDKHTIAFNYHGKGASINKRLNPIHKYLLKFRRIYK